MFTLKSKLSQILRPKLFLSLAFLVCVILANEWIQISREPMNLWQNNLLSADCGIVLTGAAGRIREGFEYLAQKKINKLIVSGVYKDAKLHEVFPYLPLYPEINSDDIILEKKSETTFGNAQQSLVLVENVKCKDIVLITSQIHMRRAYHIFKATFPSEYSIKKLSLPNSKNEKSLFDHGIEVVKSMFYYGLGLVS